MRTTVGFLAALTLAFAAPALAQTAPGQLKGGTPYDIPSWFKVGFLDFKSDVADARKQGKHVIAFMHLDDCPYCERMLKESFVKGENKEFMQKHFDVIGVNIRGDLDVAWIDGKNYTERALAQHLKIVATPTIVFLDLDANTVLRLNGYRDPQAYRYALEYVQAKAYRDQPFAAWLAARDKPAVYTLRDHPQFTKATNFKGNRKPLAILFEDRNCGECARFHEKTLSHPDVVAEMKKFQFVRLDTDSKEPIVDLDGKTTTAGEWAKALGLSYRPALALFNEGRQIVLIDGVLYHFHLKERLRFTSGAFYKQYPSMSAYGAARREELLKQGINIDFSE